MTLVRRRTWLLLAAGLVLLTAAGFGIKTWLERDAEPVPLTVDGLPVLSVSEVLRGRSTGELPNGPVAVGGYWSNSFAFHSCNPPPADKPPGELELRCNDGEFGITELNEQILIISKDGRGTVANGPHLTPWIPDDVAKVLWNLQPVFGQLYPPVPIIVIGHFDDERAADCQPEARQLCRDRLVIDRLVHFNPTAVVLPGPTMGPTPIASGEEPPPKFGPELCAGEVEYSFVGWTTMAALGFDRGDPNENLFAMITAESVPLADWSGPYQHKARLWGRRVCFQYAWEEGSMGFELIPGTTFKELQDGTHVPWNP